METRLKKCEKCGKNGGEVVFIYPQKSFPIACGCMEKMECRQCHTNPARIFPMYYLNGSTDQCEYNFGYDRELCGQCLEKSVSGIGWQDTMRYGMRFIETSVVLIDQRIAVFILSYMCAHGMELLLKAILEINGEQNIKTRFRHGLQEIYDYLKTTNLDGTLPVNDELISSLDIVLKNGGIRYPQDGIQYRNISPHEVAEYANAVILSSSKMSTEIRKNGTNPHT